MRTALRVATPLIVLLACQRDVRDRRVGSIELVLEPVPRASAPDPAPDLDHVRELVARRLAGLRAPVEVATEGGRLVVALRGDAEPEVLSRVKAAVLTRGRFEIREVAGDALGPILVGNGAIQDALSTIAGDRAVLSLILRREAAGPFEAATRRLVGRQLAMTLDDKPIAAPLLEAPIPGGRIQVTLGEYATSHALADTIVLVLKAGEPLPLPLRLLQERRVPPRAR